MRYGRLRNSAGILVIVLLNCSLQDVTLVSEIKKPFDLLVEGESADSELLWEGRTAMHAPEIDGKVYISDFADERELEPGAFHRCEITEAHDYDLVARLL